MAFLKDKTRVFLSKSQIFLIGSVFGASSFFFTAENGQFNTYIERVIPLELGGIREAWMVPLMTTFSALMGLVFAFIWGAVSDSTRSRFGRRRPFLLGGIVAGIAMMLYLLSGNFWLCFIIDVVLIGILSNSFVAARASLIPDVTVPEERGRVNSLVSIISGIFSFGAIVLFLIVNEFFKSYTMEGGEQVAYLNYTGHAIILVVTGCMIIFLSILGFFFIKENPIVENADARRMSWHELIRDSFQGAELLKHKEFFKIVLASLVFQTGTRLFYPWVFQFVTELDLPIGLMAVLLVLFVFVGFLANYMVGKISDKYGRKKPIIVIILVASVGFFLIPFMTASLNEHEGNLQAIDYVLILSGVSCIILAINVTPAGDAWAQDLINREKIGQFVGILNIMSTISQMIGPWIGSLIISTLGLEWTFFFSPFFFIASIPFYKIVKDKLRESRAVESQGA